VESIEEKVQQLRAWFNGQKGVLVAFSGGVDSSLIAFLARRFLGADQCLAVISASPSLKMSELDEARRFARTHNIPLEVIVTREMDNPNYTSNPANRCYFCKHTLYTELDAFRERYPGWVVANGQNVDDLGDYRPGLQAAKEFRICAPLQETGMNKAAVRELAAYFQLECWDKPASPCLASRLPYGEEVTLAKLRRIEGAEAYLKAKGFPICRVRHKGGTARIEVPSEQVNELEKIATELTQEFLDLGFTTVEIDREGFVSGKLNRAIGQAR
jgi:uncharacterized protein